MNSAGLIPDLNATGVYKLITPFDAAITATGIYTCVAIRTLKEIVAAGQDAEGLYYTSPYGLSSAVYQADLAAGASIITLQNSAGELTHVPSTYVAAYPKAGGVPYAVMGLAVNLGPLPVSIDLSAVTDSVMQLLHDNLGVNATIQEAMLSAVTQLSQEDDKSARTIREVAISTPETERARCLAAETALITCRQKISVLEDYILKVLSKQNTGNTGFTTPDFTLYGGFLQTLEAGMTLSPAQAEELAGYLRKLDQQTTSSFWNADPTNDQFSVAGATVIWNKHVLKDFPAAANFDYCAVLRFREDVVAPSDVIFLNYNYIPT